MSDFEFEVLSLAYHESPETLVEFLDSLPPTKFQVCKVNECLTTSEACKFMSRDWFSSELLRRVPSIVAIRFEISERLNVKQARQPRAHEFVGCPRFLVAYESTAEIRKVVYWKNRGTDDFLAIELGNKGESLMVADYAVDFLVESLVAGRSVTATSAKPQLTTIVDGRKCNLLIKSILDEDLRIFRELLRQPFDINHKLFVGNEKMKASAADIAWQQKDFSVLLELLTHNSMFPDHFNVTEVDAPAIKALVKVSAELHKAIAADNREQVREILQQNSSLRHFYDTNNVSAVAAALKFKNIELYKILLDHDVSFGPLEDVGSILKRHVPKEMRKTIRDLNSRVAKSLADRHLMTIFAKSVIAYDNQCNEQLTELVKKALRDLNDIPIGRDLLVLSAHNEKLRIHFDFNQKSILRMDPVNGSAGTSGLIYSHKGHVYIAAKDAHEEGGARNLIAVLAHELCHLGVNLVFRNGVDPYAENDEEQKSKFAAIVSKCRELKDKENIVKWVYDCYPPDEWPAELIVRVPHMLVFYSGDPSKCRELRAIYSELFKYFEDFVAPQMMRTVVLLDKIARKSFSVNCAVLTDPLRNAIFESDIDFQGQEIEFSEILERDSEVFNFLKPEQMREMLNCTEVLKIGKAPEKCGFYVERSFIDFEIEVEEVRGDWNETVRNNLLNFKKIAIVARSTKFIILADHAGAGKSLTFRHLAEKLKNKFTDHWVAYVELKQHLKSYEKFESRLTKTDDDQKTLIVEILKEILQLTDDLDGAVFESLFSANQVILLFDGFDEIAPKFKSFFLAFLQKIQSLSKSQLWISTRPQHMKELKQKFKSRPFKMMPLEEKQKRELLSTFFCDHDEKKRKFAVDEALKIAKNSYAGIENVQVLQMLAKASIGSKTQLRISETIVEAMKRAAIAKHNEIASQERDPEGKLNIWQLLQVHSLKLLFKSEFPDLFDPNRSHIKLSELSVIRKYQNVKQKWTPEAVARYGFLYVENWESRDEVPHFLHRSFVDFFAAKFFIENVFEADDDDASYEHMAVRMKLLAHAIESDSALLKILTEYAEKVEYERQSLQNFSRKCNGEVLKFLNSDEVQQVLTNNGSLKEKLSKFFAI